MKSFPELRPRWPDAVVAAAVVLLAAACAWMIWRGAGQSGALEAVVSVDGTEEFTTPLTGLNRVERTIQANGYTLKIILTDTEVWVEESDPGLCPHGAHLPQRPEHRLPSGPGHGPPFGRQRRSGRRRGDRIGGTS